MAPIAADTAQTTPTAAERVLSACLRAHALLAVDGTDPVAVPVCHLQSDGTLVIAAPAASQPSPAGVHAMLELTDHAPLNLRERVRALVWIRGVLTPVPPAEVGTLLDRMAAADPNPALLQVRSPRSAVAHLDGTGDDYILLRLTTESAVLADTTGAEAVPLDELLAAAPDPFCAVEAGWLHHLDTAHPEVAERLAARLAPRLQRGRARPLGVDRHGLWLRVEDADADHDLRVAFDRPVADVAGLNRAVRALLGCPFLNGLHARRG